MRERKNARGNISTRRQTKGLSLYFAKIFSLMGRICCEIPNQRVHHIEENSTRKKKPKQEVKIFASIDDFLTVLAHS
jgi:hypothetical protein